MTFDDTHLIVNGEVWNYPQLRKEYEGQEDTNSNQTLIQKLYYIFTKRMN